MMARAAAIDLAEKYGLVTAGELIPGRVPITRGAGPAQSLPVTEDVAQLLPGAALSGQVAIPMGRHGSTSLLWRLLAGPSSADRWCAVVGMPQLYPLTATAAGVELSKVALVGVQGPEETLGALGALCEGIPVVVVPTKGLTPRQVMRAATRARRSGTVLVWLESAQVPGVPGVDARLEAEECEWFGLRRNEGRRWGAGRLTACRLSVASSWRGQSRPRRAEVWPYGRSDDFGEAGGLGTLRVIDGGDGPVSVSSSSSGVRRTSAAERSVREQVRR
jgi:hypothetical protein